MPWLPPLMRNVCISWQKKQAVHYVPSQHTLYRRAMTPRHATRRGVQFYRRQPKHKRGRQLCSCCSRCDGLVCWEQPEVAPAGREHFKLRGPARKWAGYQLLRLDAFSERASRHHVQSAQQFQRGQRGRYHLQGAVLLCNSLQRRRRPHLQAVSHAERYCGESGERSSFRPLAAPARCVSLYRPSASVSDNSVALFQPRICSKDTGGFLRPPWAGNATHQSALSAVAGGSRFLLTCALLMTPLRWKARGRG